MWFLSHNASVERFPQCLGTAWLGFSILRLGFEGDSDFQGGGNLFSTTHRQPSPQGEGGGFHPLQTVPARYCAVSCLLKRRGTDFLAERGQCISFGFHFSIRLCLKTTSCFFISTSENGTSQTSGYFEVQKPQHKDHNPTLFFSGQHNPPGQILLPTFSPCEKSQMPKHRVSGKQLMVSAFGTGGGRQMVSRCLEHSTCAH